VIAAHESGLTWTEIGDLVGMPPAAARKRWKTAISAFQQELQDAHRLEVLGINPPNEPVEIVDTGTCAAELDRRRALLGPVVARLNAKVPTGQAGDVLALLTDPADISWDPEPNVRSVDAPPTRCRFREYSDDGIYDWLACTRYPGHPGPHTLIVVDDYDYDPADPATWPPRCFHQEWDNSDPFNPIMLACALSPHPSGPHVLTPVDRHTYRDDDPTTWPNRYGQPSPS
jgi:hypothetical protein